MNKPILIIDCSFICYQAKFTMGGDLSYDDMATGIIFGFLSRILHLGTKFETNDIVFCWDSKTNVRKKKYPWYKVRHVDEDEEERVKRTIMIQQMVLLRRKILPKIGFKNQIVQPGMESDDLMAELGNSLLDDVIIVTGDHDLYQCLRKNVKVYHPSKHKMITLERFREDFGIGSFEWSKVKAIAGCSSDKVPGVKGVGEKTAIKYLKGELTKGKKYEDIISKKGNRIARRNMKLVKLPHSKCKSIKLSNNSFDISKFKKVVKKYGLFSFTKGKNLELWKSFLFRKVKAKEKRKPRRKRAKN